LTTALTAKLDEESVEEIKNNLSDKSRIRGVFTKREQVVEFLKQTEDVVLYHQERYDGKGYPKGLKGDQIPLAARIVTLADSYDAMNSDRPYRKKIDIEEILRRIKEESGGQFDPKVVEAFVRSLNNPSLASTVKHLHTAGPSVVKKAG